MYISANFFSPVEVLNSDTARNCSSGSPPSFATLIFRCAVFAISVIVVHRHNTIANPILNNEEYNVVIIFFELWDVCILRVLLSYTSSGKAQRKCTKNPSAEI